MKNILLAPNSYKECADAVAAAEYFIKYLKPGFNIISRPLSDGGDGFLNVCKFYFDLEIIYFSITTPYDDSVIRCPAGLDRKNKILYVESADILGLKVIPPEKRHPLLLSSKGLGDLLVSVKNDLTLKKYSINKIVLGVGGTGVIDLGMGVFSAFGLKLIDLFGKAVEIIPANFYKAAKIEWIPPDLPFSIEVITDVINPLLGENGAAKVFGKQKGATGGQIEVIELGFNKILKAIENNYLRNHRKLNYSRLSGAGGGLPAGLNIFLGSEERTARDFIKDSLKISPQDKIDAVITGEGSFDSQSLSGKGASVILDMFSNKDLPVFLCCGRIQKNIKLSSNVYSVEFQNFYGSSEEAIKNFEESIKLASDVIKKSLQTDK